MVVDLTNMTNFIIMSLFQEHFNPFISTRIQTLYWKKLSD